MSVTILSLAIRHEHDVVAARQHARQIAALLDFDAQDQTRIATAVSEIARNAFTYAGGGTVEFSVEGKTSPQLFAVRVSDQGRGIADLARVLDGQYQSATGMGLGITGARRLMDHFSIESSPRGTVVSLKKICPRGAAVLTAATGAALMSSAAALDREAHAQPQLDDFASGHDRARTRWRTGLAITLAAAALLAAGAGRYIWITTEGPTTGARF